MSYKVALNTDGSDSIRLHERPKWRMRVGGLLLVCASVLISFLFVEAYFRAFDPQPIVPRYVETSSYGIRKNIANVRGEMIVPEYRHGLTTNSQGFRGTKEYSVEKPPGIYRVIVLGDSVTLGHGVEDDQTYAAILEHKLSETGPTEVINMGVSGFGTAEELIQLQHLGLAYQPDLIVLGYFPNDPLNNVVSKLYRVREGKLIRNQEDFVPAIFIRDRLYAIPGYSFLCQHSHLVNFVRNRFSAFFSEQLTQQNRLNSKTTGILSPLESELTSLLLSEVVSEAARRHIPLVTLNIPLISEGEIVTNLPSDRLVGNQSSYILDVAREMYGSERLDLLSYDKDCHPKPFAHRLIGEKLAEFVRLNILQERTVEGVRSQPTASEDRRG